MIKKLKERIKGLTKRLSYECDKCSYNSDAHRIPCNDHIIDLIERGCFMDWLKREEEILKIIDKKIEISLPCRLNQSQSLID